MYIEYDNETNKVVRRVSETVDPVSGAADGRTLTTEPVSVGSVKDIKQKAIDEATFDPDTEMAVASLYYDTESGEVYAEAEVRELEDEDFE